MPGNVLGLRETEMKDFQGNRQAVTIECNMHQGREGFGDTNEGHLIRSEDWQAPQRRCPDSVIRQKDIRQKAGGRRGWSSRAEGVRGAQCIACDCQRWESWACGQE